MNRNTIRFLVVLAVLSIVGIVVTQVYWFKRAFNAEEDQFNRDVGIALYNVANQFFEISNVAEPGSNPIKQLSTNYYVVNINTEIDANMLEHLLVREFDKKGISADFEYGIYDCTSEKMVYGSYVSMAEAEAVNITGHSLPKWRNQNYYFGVQFPKKASIITNRMGVWIFSSAVLFIVIVFFAYALFVILKQKRLSEIQKDFVNNMTHEFKTPISTIALSTEVLRDPKIVEQPERLLNYATIIQNENQRLKKQVERVLQMASLDKEQISLKKETIDIHELLREAIQGVRLNINEANGDVSLDLQAENTLILADRLHIVNVFYNLLDNAIKYTKITPEIRISTANTNGKLCVEIQDNGIGISHDERKKIFNKFYRVSTGNIHDVKGFGLGLNYVNLVVRAHGGSLRLDSTLGQGSTFKLYFENAR